MALSIKTAEADKLAGGLGRRTGETLKDAVTAALRERLQRERARRAGTHNLPERLLRLAKKLRTRYDTRPVTKAEWDAAAGDEH
jgi:antitoxin VapB